MNPPSAAEIQTATRFEALKALAGDELERVVAEARAAFRRFTGVRWESITDPDEAVEVRRAVRGMAELLYIQSSPETIETLADFDLLSSFSAGAYSETRRSPREAMEARLLVAWPWLSELLWDLMTPERHEFYLGRFESGNAPAFAVTEIEWGGGSPDTDFVWGA